MLKKSWIICEIVEKAHLITILKGSTIQAIYIQNYIPCYIKNANYITGVVIKMFQKVSCCRLSIIGKGYLLGLYTIALCK